MCNYSLPMARRLLLLNHFAVPRGDPGGTRHVELCSRLDTWDPLILAANRNLLTRNEVHSDDKLLRTVWTSAYSDNGASRILNWATYAVTAAVAGWRHGAVDVVYASSPHLLAGFTGWVLASLRRARFVLEVRDLWPRVLLEMGIFTERSAVYRILEGLETFLYCRAEAIVVLTEGVARELRRSGVPADRLRVIPNGAEPADFEWSGPREECRRKHGFDGTAFIYAGAHGPANGLELLLDAAEELGRCNSGAQFVLVGDGVAKQSLVAEVVRRRLSNVKFREPVPKSEIPALLCASDVGLHVLADVPLFHYGVSPNKLYDYMAAGLPVLTNTPGETAELVRAAGAGVAVGPTELAAGVKQMLSASNEQRRAWGESGRRFMEEHRSRRALARQLEELLDSLVPPR